MFKFLGTFYRDYRLYIGSDLKELPARVQVDQDSNKQSTI